MSYVFYNKIFATMFSLALPLEKAQQFLLSGRNKKLSYLNIFNN